MPKAIVGCLRYHDRVKEVQDHWFRLAKEEGYRSRAAYKLIDIDDRKRLLRRGDRVLDAGAAPGSWAQVAVERVGPKGEVVAKLEFFNPLASVKDRIGVSMVESLEALGLLKHKVRRAFKEQ